MVVDGGLLEDLGVGPEGDLGTRGLRLADDLDLLRGLAARELHRVNLAVALDLDHEALGQSIYNGDTDAVQTTGHLVAAAAELTTGVQDGHDDLKGAHLALGMLGHGNATAVINNRHRVVKVHGDIDAVAETRHRLVDRVVNNLPHQVVQAHGTGGADVHAGALAHRLQTLKDLNVFGTVGGCFVRHGYPLFLSFKGPPKRPTANQSKYTLHRCRHNYR